MTFKWLFLCALPAFAVPVFALPLNHKLTQFGRQNWQTGNGLPQNTIHAILQTSGGFLWLGTEGGLVRFDGLRFQTFDTQNEPSLKSNNIQELAQDGTGSLWFSTPEGVVRWNRGRPQTFASAAGLPAGRSWSLASDRSGTLWVASSEGLVQYSGGRFVTTAIPSDALQTSWTLAEAAARAGNAAALAALPLSPVSGNVRALLSSGAKTWIGTSRGLWLTDSRGRGVGHYGTKDGLPSDRITTLFRDRDGALWVGTESGIARIVNGSVDAFPANDPLSSDAINAVFEDREGDIWIGGDTSGLTVLRKQKFVTYSFREPGNSPQIRCVFGTDDGTVWIGTDGGGLKRYRDGKFQTLTTADGLSSNVILALAAQADGTLLAGTPDGLDRIPPSSNAAQHDDLNGSAEDFIRSVFADRDGSIWIGTRRGLSHVTGKQTVTYTENDGLGSDVVGALLRDSRGDLWIGTLHGLSRFDRTAASGHRFQNFTTAQGLSGNIITDLREDGNGGLWIATQDGGLDRYRGRSFSRFGARGDLPDTIFGLARDRGGNIWLSAKTGIFRVSDPDSGPGAASIVSYGTNDGLRVSQGTGTGHPVVWKTKDGDLWFATANGAALLTSAATSLNRVVPPVVIESVSVDDIAYSPNEFKSVPAGRSRVSFEYAGLSFLAPQKVQYKYRLEGFDKDWIDAGTRRVAYYTNLPPKQYRFRVIARNNDGFWNEAGATLAIRVLPHFYQTWAFYIGVLCGLALAVYGIYLWRLRQVRSRFEAVLAERNRIAREIHDTLAQGFAGISVQLEVASRLLNAAPDSAREHIDQARILARGSLKEARNSIWDLRSQQTAAPDFAARFSKLAQDVSESSSLKVQLEVHGQYRPLRPDVEDELFRIGQEAISNAVRHSGAEQIRVNLAFDSRKLRMTIADNGRGFDGLINSQGPDGHFGLKGMRERAERIHARFDVQSAIGSGTTVSVEAAAR